MKKFLVYLLFAANLGVILWFWWNSSSSFFATDLPGILLALGRLAGLLAVFFVLLQFVLMGRAVWIERTFGLDKLSRIHHWNGYATIIFILAHPILITTSYAKSGRMSFLSQYLDFVTNNGYLVQSSIAVALFVGIIFLSITIVRKKLKYESWYYVHLFTYLAIILAFSHQLELGGDFFENDLFVYYWYALYIFVFGNVLLFRFGKPLYNLLTRRFTVSRVVRETDSTTSVYITGKNLTTFRAEPGQFMILRFFAKGFWWQAHPFSLSYVPKNNELRVTIKNSGDFTSTIPSLPVGTPVLIDGPYGIFTVPRPEPKKKFLFIAGGVGITPIRAIIEKIAPLNGLILLYGNRSSKDVIFRDELDALSQQHAFPIKYVMSGEPEFAGEKGIVDDEKLSRLVPDLLERDIYVCGPPVMMDGVVAVLQKKGVPRGRVHFEKFSL